MRRQLPRNTARRRAPIVLLGSVVVLVVVVIVVFLLISRTGSGQADSRLVAAARATAASLTTVVAGQQEQAVARNTEIVGLQTRIAQLQSAAAAPSRTPVNPANGPHGFLTFFQVNKYTYVMYMAWVEANGFIHHGRLLTTDNYAPKASKSLQFTGINNNGSYSFTTALQGVSTTFTGKMNSDRSFTVNGLPWNVFSGFIGGTFTQTLHTANMQDYNTAVANLGALPK
ncbi:MAG: hypothetical protein ACRDG4_02235 [Chloroflexota bacterium]